MAAPEATPVLIPAPTGPYAVGYSTSKLVDVTRTDPFSPPGHRRVVISLFYPIERAAAAPSSPVPYMPPMASMMLDLFLSSKGLPKVCSRMQLQVSSEQAIVDFGKVPLVLVSPGLTFTRHQYNCMAQNLASEGYAVVTMDHTWEAMVVEWPDGSHTRGIVSPNVKEEDAEKHAQLLDTRVGDARFVLTQLGNLDVIQQLVPNAKCPFDTTNAAIIGHSFGGATAVCALIQDTRFKGAMNMDGSQYGKLAKTERLVVLFGRGEPDARNRSNNATWANLCKHLGHLKEINLKGSAHNTFSDLPLIFKLGGIANEGFAKEMAGTLDGERSFGTVMAYVKEFADLVLKGRNGLLYEGPSELHPEVELMSKV
ncbi:hypothetical protein DPSP01_013294 [Paraphaeosphaeria sporulosa]